MKIIVEKRLDGREEETIKARTKRGEEREDGRMRISEGHEDHRITAGIVHERKKPSVTRKPCPLTDEH